MTIDDKIRDEKLQYNINREAANISVLSSGKVDKYEYLTGEEIIPLDQKRVMEQAKFTYSLFGKAFEKHKNNWRSKKKKIRTLEEHEKQLVESNELIKKDFNIDKDSIPLEEQKKISESVNERSSEFVNLEKRINLDNLICKCKTEGISPKDFRNYQDPIKIFKDLRDEYKPKRSIKRSK